MFNVGVHMLSLAGEHLLVQICFMLFFFYFILFFALLFLLFFCWEISAPSRGEGHSIPWPAYIHGKQPQKHHLIALYLGDFILSKSN